MNGMLLVLSALALTSCQAAPIQLVSTPQNLTRVTITTSAFRLIIDSVIGIDLSSLPALPELPPVPAAVPAAPAQAVPQVPAQNAPSPAVIPSNWSTQTAGNRPGVSKCGRQADAYQPDLASTLTRIIGGNEAKPHSWPWLVRLTINLGEGYAMDCGANILRVSEDIHQSDILLTAAHCATKLDTMATKPAANSPSQYVIIAGNHLNDVAEKDEQTPKVSDIRFHPDFKFDAEHGANNDLALLKLETPLNFTDAVRPICLPEAGEIIPLGKVCVAAGWGRNDTKEMTTSNALQQVISPIHEPKTCSKAWTKPDGTSAYVEEEMICAGNMDGSAGACQGDSGGGLACQDTDGRWKLYGTTSFGIASTCVEPGKPANFARVGRYVDWITENVKDLSALKA